MSEKTDDIFEELIKKGWGENVDIIQEHITNLQQENKQLKEELKNKPDTKWTLTTKDGKELTIIQSERIDMQEELNNTITKLFNQLKNKDSILTELEEWLKDEIRPDAISDTTLMSYSITDKPIKKQVLDYIEKLKEKYK